MRPSQSGIDLKVKAHRAVRWAFIIYWKSRVLLLPRSFLDPEMDREPQLAVSGDEEVHTFLGLIEDSGPEPHADALVHTLCTGL